VTHPLRSIATTLFAATVFAFAQAPVAFSDLQPILEARCTLCHAGPNPAVGLALDTEAGLLAGGVRGAAIVPGDPEASELVRRLRGSALPRMPLTGPPWLGEGEIDLFARWIAALRATDAASVVPESAAIPTGGVAGANQGEGEAPIAPPSPAAPEVVTYADVAPIFAQHCLRCHAARGAMGPAPEGYRLDAIEEVLRFDVRARVVPFAPEASELVRRVLGQATPRMPFDGPPWLSDAELARIVAWVADGARDANAQPAVVPVGAELRLHGTWRADGTLDGLPLYLRGARIDDDARRGGMVQIRAVLGDDGAILVSRVRGP
jgi:mono/diheme cytochrome c family protein